MNKKIVVSLLVIIEIISIFLVYKTRPVEDVVLEDVKLKENEPSNNGFALMLEQDDGTYKESNSSTWPTDMKFNNELSGCIDVNGNIIENSLSFDTTNNLVNVSVGETAFCYVYFDIIPTLVKFLIENVSSKELWNMTEEVGIDVMDVQEYRYVGTNPNNYICFGTTDKDTCINDTDKYMYRIIGIFEDESGFQHAKLIKKEALNKTYKWNSKYTKDVDWNNSDLYNGLNGSYFLTNTSYPCMQDTTWTNKIATWNYTMTNTEYITDYTNSVYGLNYRYNTGKVVYLHELNKSGYTNEICYYDDGEITNCNIGEWKILPAKVSLMYASDFSLSLGSIALSYTSSSNSETLKTGWIHLSNNDSNPPNSYEWTMSSGGTDIESRLAAIFIGSSGVFNFAVVSGEIAARPVFYLEPDVKYLMGTGTINDPFILKN